MLNLFRTLPPAVLVAALLAHAPLGFAESSTLVDDLSAYKCRDVMRMSGDARDIALAVLHGYTLGKKGVVRYAPADLSKVTNEFIEHCLDHPSDNAMEAFAKIAK